MRRAAIFVPPVALLAGCGEAGEAPSPEAGAAADPVEMPPGSPSGQVLLIGEGTGGRQYINAGPIMRAGDITVEVRRAVGDQERVGSESTRWPASLAVRGQWPSAHLSARNLDLRRMIAPLRLALMLSLAGLSARKDRSPDAGPSAGPVAEPGPDPQLAGAALAVPALDLRAIEPGDGEVLGDHVGTCSFADATGTRLVLVGIPGDRASLPVAVARPGGRQVTTRLATPGLNGNDPAPTFDLEGVRLTTARRERSGSAWPADVDARDGAGSEQIYPTGEWSCGI